MQRIKNMCEKIGGSNIIFFGIAGIFMMWMTYRKITDHFPAIPAEFGILAVADFMYIVIFVALIRAHNEDRKNKPVEQENKEG